MKWSWPLPGFVPWDFPAKVVENPFTRGITFAAPVNQPVCAVESGIIHNVCPSDWVVLQGPSGLVSYEFLETVPGLQVGQRVERGERIGRVRPLSDGYGSRLVITMSDMDPTPKLLKAWTRVTPRFHRDAPPIPTESADRRMAINALHDHPLWHYPLEMDEGEPEDIGGGLYECLDIDFQYVDPTLERIVGNDGWGPKGDPRNTAFRVWLDAGGWYDKTEFEPEPPEGWKDFNKWGNVHDTNLDCGGATLEDALLELATRVQWFYGPDRKDGRLDCPMNCGGDLDAEDQYVSHHEDAGDGFCSKCGYLVQEWWKDVDDEASRA